MRASILIAGLMLAGCDIAPPPERQSEAARKAAEHHELRDSIQQPIDRAKAAGDPVQKADQEHDKALEDAGG